MMNMPSKMDKKENIERIKERYPNEWLLIVDYETDASTRIIRGRLVNHSKSREEIHRALSQYKGKKCIHYLGKLPQDVGGSILITRTKFEQTDISRRVVFAYLLLSSCV
jgi:hypothetical protein